MQHTLRMVNCARHANRIKSFSFSIGRKRKRSPRSIQMTKGPYARKMALKWILISVFIAFMAYAGVFLFSFWIFYFLSLGATS